MKPQKLFLNALAVFMLCTSLQCKKDKTGIDALPPITQEGKNTFGCLVNGINLSSISPVSITRERNKVGCTIGIIDRTSKYGGRYLSLKLEKTISDQFTLSCVYYKSKSNDCEYELCPPGSYSINILRFDDAEAILSGTFAVDIPASDGCPAVKITDGRFDIQFYY